MGPDRLRRTLRSFPLFVLSFRSERDMARVLLIALLRDSIFYRIQCCGFSVVLRRRMIGPTKKIPQSIYGTNPPISSAFVQLPIAGALS
mmetsp:Transcript_29183/g.80161  ORF Transcript_29183/g.80161 Transcript_29183/m.80161 type:complete len:89 (-) Transcript_29183:135-401(-)